MQLIAAGRSLYRVGDCEKWKFDAQTFECAPIMFCSSGFEKIRRFTAASRTSLPSCAGCSTKGMCDLVQRAVGIT